MKQQINNFLVVVVILLTASFFSVDVLAQADPVKITVSIEGNHVSLSQPGDPLKIKVANISAEPLDLSKFVFSLISLSKSERAVATAETARLGLPNVVIKPGEQHEFEVKIDMISWYRERKPGDPPAPQQATAPYRPKLSGRHFLYATIMDCVKVVEPDVSEEEAPLRSCVSNKIAVQVRP